MVELITWESLAALLALTSLEVVLGIDNIVFIALLAGKLKPEQQASARRWGLGLAMGSRILLLLGLSWTLGLVRPLFSLWDHSVSGRDIILLGGGLFLLLKATQEIYLQVEGDQDNQTGERKPLTYSSALLQIIILDTVFSLDSVITALGMARHLPIMVAAIVIAILFMIAFSGTVSRFIEKHPSFRVLALAFLLLVGVMLVAEGMGKHLDRGYIYFAMAFSLLVEIVNLRIRARRKSRVPV